MAVLGLRFCPRAFSSCGKRGPLFIAVRGPLTIAASLVVEHRLQTRRLSMYIFTTIKTHTHTQKGGTDYATTGINLKNTMLRSQTQNVTYCMIPFI